jgi:membrane-associated HD superfamily phosphohydrolase
MNKSAAKKKPEKQAPKGTSSGMAVVGEASDAGSMDKIRDILFGNQMKEYDKRFKRMEEQLFKEMSEVRESGQKRLETLETYFKKELGVLKDRLQNEIEERAEAEKKSLREFNDATSSLGKKIAKLEDTMTAHATDLHDQLLLQSKNITADMDDKFEKSAKNNKEALQELGDIKADRSMLAELFMQFALQFSSENVHEIAARKSE